MELVRNLEQAGNQNKQMRIKGQDNESKNHNICTEINTVRCGWAWHDKGTKAEKWTDQRRTLLKTTTNGHKHKSSH